MGTYVRLNYQNKMEYARNTFFSDVRLHKHLHETVNSEQEDRWNVIYLDHIFKVSAFTTREIILELDRKCILGKYL